MNAHRTTVGVVLALLQAGPAAASHGQLVGGVVVESARLQAVRDQGSPEACAIAGAVHNGSPGPVIVRVTYQARDPAGALLVARARVSALAAGERRAFTSSPLSRDNGSHEPCAGVRDLLLEATAEPAP